MSQHSTFPQTLQEAIKYFADKETCTTFMAQLRWPEGVTCPNCEGKEVSCLSTRFLWKCKACKKQFSVKQGTVITYIRADYQMKAVFNRMVKMGVIEQVPGTRISNTAYRKPIKGTASGEPSSD